MSDIPYNDFESHCIHSWLAPKEEILRKEIEVLQDYQVRGYVTVGRMDIGAMITERKESLRQVRHGADLHV